MKTQVKKTRFSQPCFVSRRFLLGFHDAKKNKFLVIRLIRMLESIAQQWRIFSRIWLTPNQTRFVLMICGRRTKQCAVKGPGPHPLIFSDAVTPDPEESGSSGLCAIRRGSRRHPDCLGRQQMLCVVGCVQNLSSFSDFSTVILWVFCAVTSKPRCVPSTSFYTASPPSGPTVFLSSWLNFSSLHILSPRKVGNH